MLFIDTSHTVKTGDDVPWLFDEILPRLAPGRVRADIMTSSYRFDYPLERGSSAVWGWNEHYLVRAFLAFNAGFEVLAGAQYLHQRHRDVLLETFPGFAAEEARSGGSLWIRRSR